MADRQQKTVAVVGASTDRSKFGNKAVRAYEAQGWKVYPVTPKGGEVEGHQAYTSLEDVPRPVDRVSLYLPPKIGLEILPAVAAANPTEFWVNPGAESSELIDKARKLGLDPILACSIIDVGMSPAQLPE